MIELLETWELPAKTIAAFSATAGFFAAVDGVSSKEARRDLTNYLRSSDFPALSKKLPSLIAQTFNRIFGEKHFTFMTFAISCLFSLGSTSVLYFLARMNFGWGLHVISDLDRFVLNSWVVIGTYLAWSLLVDFLNLYKTRLVIQILSNHHLAAPVLVLLIIADYVIGLVVFLLGFGFALLLTGILSWYFPHSITILGNFLLFAAGRVFPVYFPTPDYVYLELIIRWTVKPLGSLTSVLFYAGMVPSIWIWLYAISAMTTKLVARSAPGIRFLTYFLDIEEHPIRSVGLVAATLVGAIYLAARVTAPLFA